MTGPIGSLWKLFAWGKKKRIPPQHTAYRAHHRYGVSTAKIAYRGDFYVPQNIIGYAGPIGKATIFFQRGTTIGHIVQSDRDSDNIGREKLDDVSHIEGLGYYLANEVIHGSSVAVERFIYPTGQLSIPMYIYRHPFIDLRQAPQAIKDMAVPPFERAIRRFYMKKPKWDGTPEVI